MFGNFSHQRAVYLKTDLGSITIQEDQYGIVQRGTPITGVPDFLSTFGVDYDHRNWFLRGDEFHARFEGQYTGHQATSYDLTGFENLGPLPYQPAYGTYGYYSVVTGATTYDPNGGLSPFVLFNLDLNYALPVKTIGVAYLKKLDSTSTSSICSTTTTSPISTIRCRHVRRARSRADRSSASRPACTRVRGSTTDCPASRSPPRSR